MTAVGLRAADRGTVAAGGALAAVTGAAWVAVAAGAGMDAGAAAFLGAWLVMMTAMMLPSAAPLVLVHRRSAGAGSAALLVLGYLAVWGAVGLPAWAASQAMHPPRAAVAGVLAAAGLYQLTPLKRACLRRCRSPIDFLLLRHGHGPLRLGAEHGVYCVGCCWGLMAVLVVAGAMGLAWAAAIALLVFGEKVVAAGEAAARLTGAVLMAAALVVVLA